MIPIPLMNCIGLDTRRGWKKDAFRLIDCSNVQVLPGGSIASRPALIKDCDLHAQSVGLYTRGDFLRCVVPSGQSYQELSPFGSRVIYDGIGQGGSFSYAEVVGSDSFGISSAGPFGYVAILRSDNGLVEHHWIRDPPASGSTYLSTRVNLPFTPGRALKKVATKIVADDPANGYFRYCSTLDPSDWLAEGDAGFEAAQQNVSGAREMVALGVHRGNLAVVYANAVQLWQMDALPANIGLLQVMNGPGTRFPQSIANIAGDLHFLGPAGFSNFATANIAGETDNEEVGDPIQTLTDAIAAGTSVVSLFSQRRGQYLAAVGATVYCLAIHGDERKWTVWTVPVEIEAMAELDGVIYVRSGDVLYHFDDEQGRDSGVATDLAWSWQTHGMGGPDRVQSVIKALRRLIPHSTASATWKPVVDDRVLTAARVTIPGSVSPIGVGLQGSGRRIGISCAGTGLMRCDGLTILAEEAGV